MEKKDTKYQKPYNLEPNVEAALSYLIPPLTGIPVFVMEKENKFVKFHAFQSILYGILIFVTVALVDTFWYLLGLFRQLIGLAFFAGWLYMMWEAYNNRETQIPVLGKIAKDQVDKPKADKPKTEPEKK
jgi:uncharacterized membrane protein